MVSKMSKRYAVATTIQTFKHRYVISEEQLQGFNEDAPVQLDWLEDSIACEDLYEFSQKHINESILETEWMSEEEVLALFPKELEYLDDCSIEEKIHFINHNVIDKGE